MAEQTSEKSIFLHAIGLANSGERACYLDEVCRDRPGLRAEVDALLAAHDRLGGCLPATGLESASVDPSASEETVECHEPDEAIGMVLAGRYQLLEAIGEGGMGTVWLAQQTEPVKRLVAVKLIKAGMDSKAVLTRFEAERQALALMDHPNIARVLDGGTTEGEPGGVSPRRPYFVMELVKGMSITQFCDAHRLTIRQRLELFVPVCQAIQHAHQKGIIHRDIKPSNVLVALCDDRPVVKVIDFGVAKAMGQHLTEQSLHTGFGTVVGTLEYMSPEQAEINQLDIDTRSDIYSLGVLLYELLTGSPPFTRKELEKGSLLEMLRVIREEEPTRPSTKLSTAEGLPTLAANRGTEPAKLTRLMRGELDWIVMKALEKDRSRRYEAANGFAQDVQRYLDDEQVQAYPPSAWYRFRKFARRNRRALVGAVLLGVTLLAAVVGLAISNRLIERERARTEEANARLNANLWLSISTLDEVSVKVPEWSLRDPQRKKEYHELLGKMLVFYEQFAAQHGTDPQVQVNLALHHLNFGNLLLAGGDRASAAEHYHRALDLQTQVVADCSDVGAYQGRLADVRFHLADLLTQAGQTTDAVGHYERGFRILEQLMSESSTEFAGGSGPVAAERYRFLAWHRATCPDPRFRDPARAVQAGQKAVELGRVEAWRSVAIAQYRAGDWQSSVAALEKAMASGGGKTEFLFLAMTHWKLGDKAKARQWYDRAIQGVPRAPSDYPVRFERFRAEAAELLGIDTDQEAGDNTTVPAKR